MRTSCMPRAVKLYTRSRGARSRRGTDSFFLPAWRPACIWELLVFHPSTHEYTPCLYFFRWILLRLFYFFCLRTLLVSGIIINRGYTFLFFFIVVWNSRCSIQIAKKKKNCVLWLFPSFLPTSENLKFDRTKQLLFVRAWYAIVAALLGSSFRFRALFILLFYYRDCLRVIFGFARWPACWTTSCVAAASIWTMFLFAYIYARSQACARFDDTRVLPASFDPVSLV